jgi:polysaccharide pyruvyl transferase CsaB
VSHVLICGAAGYTNVGDDAILLGILAQLGEALPGRRLRVAGGPELGSLLCDSEAAPISYDDRAELARAVEEADLVILGGGGLLYDVGYGADLQRLLSDPPDRYWLYEMARIAAASAAAERPVMLYSIGAGPLVTTSAQRVAKFVCAQARATTLRDQQSADLLASCSVPKARLHISADPAIMLGPAAGDDLAQRLGLAGRPRPWIAVNVRPWGDKNQTAALVRAVAEALRAVRGRLGGTAMLLPFQRLHEDDLPVLREIADATADCEPVLVDAPLGPGEVTTLFSQCDAVIGMRMHALVLALSAGTPFVGISYDSKVEEFAAAAGAGEYTHSASEVTAESLADSCQSVLQQAELRGRLTDARERMRESAATSPELAKSLLDTGRVPAARPAAVSPAEAGRIRVLMRIRPDHLERPGGDTVQMNKTKEQLEELGVEVAVSADESPDLSSYDLVHAFNLGRPEEPSTHCRQAAEAGKAVALSTVYWDFAEFWEWGDTDYWLLPRPEEGLPEPRMAPVPGPIEVRRRARLDQLRRNAVDCAHVYLPNGDGEAELLSDSYAMDMSRTVVVTNAVDEAFFTAKPEVFVEKYGLRDFVLCAARIEKRKNQLALVAALRGTGLPLVMVGQANPQEYLDLCRRYADENVVFIDAVNHEELASAYAAAKVHALPGWFETPGLSSLEAAAAGRNIVSTDRGTAREYFGDMAWYCDPRSIDSIREAVLAAYESAPRDDLRARVRERCTWRRAAESTLAGYRMALGLHQETRAEERREAAVLALRSHTDYLAKLAADRAYEAQRMREWGETVEAELKRLQEEFGRVTSRRLHRWSSAVARAGWAVLRVLGVKQ